MPETKIEWCGYTFNPWRGCTKVSEGCRFCYAEVDLSVKLHGIKWGPNGTRVKTSDDYWKKPLAWNRKAEREDVRRKVFCASLADVFEDWSGEILDHKGAQLFSWIDGFSEQDSSIALTMDHLRLRLFTLIDQTPHLDWLLLTKRPENVRRMWPQYKRQPTEPKKPELWRQIREYPHYQVSSHGHVRSLGLRGKVLSPDIGEKGHCRVHLYDGFGNSCRELIHRIVLTSFDRPPRKGEQCRHLDDNAQNNCIDNLSWGTQADNWNDSKRHGTHRRYSKLTEHQVSDIRQRYKHGATFTGMAPEFGVSDTQIRNICLRKQWSTGENLFRNNCWLGTSVEDQRSADKRIPELLKLRDLVPVLFLSCEPLLGPIDLTFDSGYESGGSQGWIPGDNPDWVIVGGESGSHARPCNIQWIRDIVRQCRGAGVPIFVKQLGSRPSERDFDAEWPVCLQDGNDGFLDPVLRDSKGGDIDEWPDDLKVRDFPQSLVIRCIK